LKSTIAPPLSSATSATKLLPHHVTRRKSKKFATEPKILQVKYLNNIIEQDHRFVKRITAPMLGFKAFHSAEATLAGIETTHMIRKGQLHANGLTAFQQFAALAA
jgi:putative transposase